MDMKPRAHMRGVLVIWAVGIALGLGAGAVAASMLRQFAPETAPGAPVAASPR